MSCLSVDFGWRNGQDAQVAELFGSFKIIIKTTSPADQMYQGAKPHRPGRGFFLYEQYKTYSALERIRARRTFFLEYPRRACLRLADRIAGQF